MRRLLLASTCMLVVLTSGCVSDGTDEPAPTVEPTIGPTVDAPEADDLSLSGTSWTLDSIIEGDATSSAPDGVPEVVLEVDEHSRAGFTTGCNSGGATLTVQGATVTFDSLTSTSTGCDGDASAVESVVMRVLGEGATATMSGDELSLAAGTTVLVYRRR